jgi:hypothetical protein
MVGHQIKITEEIRQVYLHWKAGEITAVKAMKQTKLKKATFYNIAKKLDGEYKGNNLFPNENNFLKNGQQRSGWS